ncbi:glycosyltransferase family 9 protein [Chlorobium sp.]|uniref:glycosyltransferase family 9 protein n=1 Tax=Chlorobium sp. TaxID=1095 RepID=UPI0025BD1C3B|nr:glycosyltransferase family 9 protein [Chlorobium sp.]
MWSAEKWSLLLDAFPDRRFIVFSAPKERDLLLKKKLEDHHDNVTASPVTGNLSEVAELMRTIGFLVSLDTSLIHVASCLNVPVVGLYRNRRDDIVRFSPLSERHEIVVSSGELVDDIPAGPVVEAVSRLCGIIGTPANTSSGALQDAV